MKAGGSGSILSEFLKNPHFEMNHAGHTHLYNSSVAQKYSHLHRLIVNQRLPKQAVV